MISSKPKLSAEEQRITESNAKRAVAAQRDYVTLIRTDIHVGKQAIAALRKQIGEMEEALKRRVERLETAEAKLRKMEPSR